jgi:transposase InsO family protein
VVKPSPKRRIVDHLKASYRVSERRACGLVRQARTVYHYRSRRDPRTEVRQRMRELAAARVRYGYRKIRVLLQREGFALSKKVVYRLYREEGLSLRYRASRKRRMQTTRPMRATVGGPNFVWSLDFVSDQLSHGQRFRALTVLDVFTREAIVIEVGQQLRAADVVAVLERLRRQRGCPETLCCDNGSEFTSQLVDLWAYHHRVRIDYSRPGKPTDNAFVESFNGTFRDECLNAHWFESIADARAVVESWRVEYNESRPHRALGEVPPAEFARRFRARPEPTGQPNAEDSHRHWH